MAPDHVDQWSNYQRLDSIGRHRGRKETLIGRTKAGHEVLHWEDYGVVCPDEITTNGSAGWLLQTRARPVEVTPPGAAYFVGWALYRLGYAIRSQIRSQTPAVPSRGHGS